VCNIESIPNTTLVQLKESASAPSLRSCTVFQYHTGSIKSHSRPIRPLEENDNFNTTLVQLKGQRQTPRAG